MTLMYRLFDKPRNVGEFAKKAIREKKSHIEITVGDKSEGLFGGASFHHFPLVLKSETIRLNVDGATAFNVLGNTKEDAIRDLVAKHNALIKATRVGRYLEGQGLKVFVEGTPLSEIHTNIERYRQDVASKSRDYGFDMAEKGAPVLWVQ